MNIKLIIGLILLLVCITACANTNAKKQSTPSTTGSQEQNNTATLSPKLGVTLNITIPENYSVVVSSYGSKEGAAASNKDIRYNLYHENIISCSGNYTFGFSNSTNHKYESITRQCNNSDYITTISKTYRFMFTPLRCISVSLIVLKRKHKLRKLPILI